MLVTTPRYISLVEFADRHNITISLLYWWLKNVGILDQVGAIRQNWIDQSYFVLRVGGTVTEAKITNKGLAWMDEIFDGTMGVTNN